MTLSSIKKLKSFAINLIKQNNMKSILLTVSCFILFVFNSLSQSFNYYYGNIHSQSSYSDGNKDSSTSLMTKPLQDFNYAKLSLHTDFYGISDHNHLSAGMNSPSHFHLGLADANTANNEGNFVAMYGQEWGVISGGGHVIVYGYDSLIGWDVGDYDVYVSQNNYAALWNKINAKVGAFAYLAHPSSTDYTNLFTTALNTTADNAIIGMAARSGPAFSTNSTYSNPSTSDFIARYNEALSLGYHLGVGLDHDTHNSVFGRQTAGRLVVLAPVLTRANILNALRKMNFYSSDDWNAKVDFNINSQPMGSIYTHSTSPTLNVTITDPDGEATTSITVYSGVPGSGSLPTVLTSNTGSNSLSFTHAIANNTSFYYYLEIVQADGDKIWTSPIWYTRNNIFTSNAPVTNFSVSAINHCVGQPISLTDLSTNFPTAWNWTMLGATTNSSTINNPTVTYTVAGTYSITIVPTNSTGTGLPFTQTITIVNPPNIITSSTSICSGQTAGVSATGATTYFWNTGATTASISVTPTVTTNYTVTGTTSGCSNSKVVSVTVNLLPSVSVTSTTICAGSTGTLVASGANTYTWNTGAVGANLPVSPTVNTNYTVTGTSIAGCVKSWSASVTVGTAPSIAVNSTSICSGSSAILSASGVSTYTWNTGANTPTISVSPLASIVYTVTGNLIGCVASATKTVGVSVVANPTITASNATVCSGSTATITATGATTYSWNTGSTSASIFVAPTISTNYTVTGDLNSCIKTLTTSVTINPNPILIMVSSSTLICFGQTAILNVSGASNYIWNTGAITASISVSPTITTTYSVQGLNTYSCMNIATITQSVYTCTGINHFNLNGENDFTIYPNPTIGELIVSLNYLTENTFIEVFNSLGQVTYHEKMDESNTRLNLKEYQEGIYFIKISNNIKSSTLKFAKIN